MAVKNSNRNPKNCWVFVDKNLEAEKHRTESCATTKKYRCMRKRCGKRGKNGKLQGSVRAHGAGKGVQLQNARTGKNAFGRTRHGQESGPKWRGVSMVQKVFGLCVVPSGAKAGEPLQTRREERHERVRNVVEKHPQTWRRKGARQKRERIESRRRKGRLTRKEYKRPREEFEVGSWHKKGVVDHRQKRQCWKTEERYPKRRET